MGCNGMNAAEFFSGTAPSELLAGHSKAGLERVMLSTRRASDPSPPDGVWLGQRDGGGWFGGLKGRQGRGGCLSTAEAYKSAGLFKSTKAQAG